MALQKKEKRIRSPKVAHVTPDNFDVVWGRIKTITGADTQNQLAKILGVSQPSISSVKKTRNIPPDWYLRFYEIFGVNIIWLKTGQEPIYIIDRGKPVYTMISMDEPERLARLLFSKLVPPDIAQEVSQTLSFKFLSLEPTNTLEEVIYKIMPGELAVRFFHYFFDSMQKQKKS